MSVIILNNIDIDHKNIYLKENNDIINIKYNLKHYTLIGLSYLINNYEIKIINNNYYLLINDTITINKLKNIDTYFKNKIKNYNSFIKDNLIKLIDNNYIKNIYLNKNDNCILHLKYLKNNYVILHLNE